MPQADLQTVVREVGGGTGHFNGALHQLATQQGVPEGQLLSRLGALFGVLPQVVLQFLNGKTQAELEALLTGGIPVGALLVDGFPVLVDGYPIIIT